MSDLKPRFGTRPAGTTAAPAYTRAEIEDIPAAREVPELLTRIDWRWIARTLDAGEAVGIAVDPAGVGALIDAVQCRLGYETVIRLTDCNSLWVCRPEALT